MWHASVCLPYATSITLPAYSQRLLLIVLFPGFKTQSFQGGHCVQTLLKLLALVQMVLQQSHPSQCPCQFGANSFSFLLSWMNYLRVDVLERHPHNRRNPVFILLLCYVTTAIGETTILGIVPARFHPAPKVFQATILDSSIPAGPP